MDTARIDYKEASLGKWRNLDTGRELANRPKNNKDFWFAKNPRVAGSLETLTKFFNSRGLPLPELTEYPPTETVLRPGSQTARPPTTRMGIAIRSDTKGNRDMEDLAARINRIALSTIPVMNPIISESARKVPSILISSSKDIRSISRDKLKTMNKFTLNGIEGEMAILEVMDGDTYDIAFMAPLNLLSPFGTAREEDKHIVIRDIFRLYGIDAAEKNTVQGQIAAELAKQYVDEQKGYMYGKIMGWDKYGRGMVELLTSNRESLAKLIISHEHPRYGKIAVPYHGAIKDEYMKNIPRYNIVRKELIDYTTGRPFPIREYLRELIRRS